MCAGTSGESTRGRDGLLRLPLHLLLGSRPGPFSPRSVTLPYQRSALRVRLWRALSGSSRPDACASVATPPPMVRSGQFEFNVLSAPGGSDALYQAASAGQAVTLLEADDPSGVPGVSFVKSRPAGQPFALQFINDSPVEVGVDFVAFLWEEGDAGRSFDNHIATGDPFSVWWGDSSWATVSSIDVFVTAPNSTSPEETGYVWMQRGLAHMQIDITPGFLNTSMDNSSDSGPPDYDQFSYSCDYFTVYSYNKNSSIPRIQLCPLLKKGGLLG